MRSNRRRDLMRVLHENRPSSQQDIVAALRAAGHDVTQATVSRDLREIGATKVRIGGEFLYRLPDEIPRSPGGDLMMRNLIATLEEFAVDVRVAGNLVILATAPGHASAVARAIDLADLDDVVGTVAGDDTIFVATPDASTANDVRRRWSGVSTEGGRGT
jgi:transcriptional regulator of arginine metabolism